MAVNLDQINLPSTAVQKVVDPYVDPGNLLLMDRAPIEGELADDLVERARNNAQLLFNRVWELDRNQVDSAILAVLPAPTFRIPREKRVPEKREKTPWEQYAEKKGIQKRKKDKKVFDEATKEWKPTYGYRRGNDDTKDWLIEIPEGQDPNKDYFAERVEKKKERVAKNEMQRMKNLARQLKTKVKTGAAIDANIGVGVAPEEKSKQQIRFAVDRAKAATASVGKFQKKEKGEKENVKTGKKRKFEANEAGGAGEKQRGLDILSRLKNKKAKIVEEKVASIAGPEKTEKKERIGKPKQARQKSQIHRQQWFKNKKADKKRNPGNSRRTKK